MLDRPSGDRRSCTRSTATGSGRAASRQARAERALLRDAARAPLRPPRPSDRASARRVARAPAAAALRRSRASASARTGCGGASFTHFYRLPRTTPRHTVEMQPRRAAPHRRASPTPADRRLVLVPGRRGEATRRARCSRSTASSRSAIRPAAPGLALAVQVLAGRALRGAARAHRRRRAGASSSPARRTRASARWSTRSSRRSEPARARASPISAGS